MAAVYFLLFIQQEMNALCSVSEGALRLLSAIRRYSLLAVVALAVLAVTYRALFKDNPSADFRYFFASGRMWSQGVDPYNIAAFHDFGRALFGPDNGDFLAWVYPPQWAVLTVPVSLLPYQTARIAWHVGNLVALLCAVGLLYKYPQPDWAKALFVLWALTGEPAREVFYWGQSSAILALGVSLLCVGLLDDKKRWQALGLAITFLKPQVGIVFLVLIVLYRPRVALAALLISSVMAIPAILLVGPENLPAMLQAYLTGIQSYGGSVSNLPSNMTGIGVLLNLPIAAPVYSILAAGTAPFLARALERSGLSDAQALIVSASVAILFFVPLHTNDLLLALPLAAMVSQFEGKPRVILFVALALLYRPWDLALPSIQPDMIHERRAIIEAIAGCLAGLAALLVIYSRSRLAEVPRRPRLHPPLSDRQCG